MRRYGLTLMELLVALFILGLVMAVIVPVMGRVRAQGRTAVCGSNIRQILIAMMSYSTEHQTLPPGMSAIEISQKPPGGRAGGGSDMSAWWWFHYLDFETPGRDLRSILACPSRDMNISRNVLLFDYGVNLHVCKSRHTNPSFKAFWGNPVCVSGIRNAGQTFLVMDCGYTIITGWHAMAEPPVKLAKELGNDHTAYIPGLSINKDRDLWPFQVNDALEGRHPGRTVNTGFVDGHLERKKAEAFLVEPVEPAKEQCPNLPPIWVPE